MCPTLMKSFSKQIISFLPFPCFQRIQTHTYLNVYPDSKAFSKKTCCLCLPCNRCFNGRQCSG